MKLFFVIFYRLPTLWLVRKALPLTASSPSGQRLTGSTSPEPAKVRKMPRRCAPWKFSWKSTTSSIQVYTNPHSFANGLYQGQPYYSGQKWAFWGWIKWGHFFKKQLWPDYFPVPIVRPGSLIFSFEQIPMGSAFLWQSLIFFETFSPWGPLLWPGR